MRRSRPLPAVLGALTAVMLLAGCNAPTAATSSTPLRGYPDGRSGPFAPVDVPGVAGCGSLTLAQEGAGSTGVVLPCLTGPRTIDLDELGGRLTVVNLWASWCSVCREEMKVLKAADEASGQGVQYVGVDVLDEAGPAARFLTETGVTYPQLYDQQGDLLKYTRVQGLPVTLLLDESGREIRRHVGELTDDDLQELLDGG